jgi:hypothetical protein
MCRHRQDNRCSIVPGYSAPGRMPRLDERSHGRRRELPRKLRTQSWSAAHARSRTQYAAGCEDCDDVDALRTDPALKIAVGRAGYGRNSRRRSTTPRPRARACCVTPSSRGCRHGGPGPEIPPDVPLTGIMKVVSC